MQIPWNSGALADVPARELADEFERSFHRAKHFQRLIRAGDRSAEAQDKATRLQRRCRLIEEELRRRGIALK